MPMFLPRKRASSSYELLQVLAGNHDRAAVGPFQSGHDHQQSRLAGAGWSEQAHGLAAAYIQVDVSEDMNAGGAAPE
jgi:hypothetical protein